MITNAQSKSVPAQPTNLPSLSHTCFLCQRTKDDNNKQNDYIVIIKNKDNENN